MVKMNTKLQVLIFTLVLLAGMFTVSEGYFGGGGSVGKKKRSNLVQVERVMYLQTNLITNRDLSG